LNEEETTMTFNSEKKELRIILKKMTEVTFADFEEEEPSAIDEKMEQSNEKMEQSNAAGKYSDFPFDENGIYLEFEIQNVNVGDIMEKRKIIGFEIKEGELMMLKTCDLLPEFNIAINPNLTKWENDRSKIEYRFHLYREPNYILLSTSAPLFLINISILTALAFPPSSLAEKLSVIVTLMLALFAFMPSLRSFIPKVSYLTVVEWQLYNILGIMLLVLVEAVTNYILSETSDAITSIIKWVIFGISIVATVGQVIYLVARWTKTKIRNEGYLAPCGCIMKKEQDNYKFVSWRKGCALKYPDHKKMEYGSYRNK